MAHLRQARRLEADLEVISRFGYVSMRGDAIGYGLRDAVPNTRLQATVLRAALRFAQG